MRSRSKPYVKPPAEPVSKPVLLVYRQTFEICSKAKPHHVLATVSWVEKGDLWEITIHGRKNRRTVIHVDKTKYSPNNKNSILAAEKADSIYANRVRGHFSLVELK